VINRRPGRTGGPLTPESEGYPAVRGPDVHPNRLGRGPPLPRLAGATGGREKARTRATKRENSITLAAPAGDEADSPDQVLASTLLGAKGGGGELSPQRTAMRRGA
jgi:hypothetical protein